jgi:hypothetical protein
LGSRVEAKRRFASTVGHNHGKSQRAQNDVSQELKMKNKPIGFTVFLFVLLFTALAACSSTPKAAPVETPRPPATSTPAASVTPAVVKTPTLETFSDPFSYCASVGTIDKPDTRYSGLKTSDVIVKGYLKAAGLDVNADYPSAFKDMTIWRCMDKKVYACNFGANLPCDSKANTDKNPTQAMADFCKENQNSDFIPMVVTGHETIYSWHCVKDTPALLDQISRVDASGYIENIWYPITPVP